MPLGASFIEDAPLVQFVYLVFTCMPGGVTLGDSCLSWGVPCLSSAIIPLCLATQLWSSLFKTDIWKPQNHSFECYCFMRVWREHDQDVVKCTKGCEPTFFFLCSNLKQKKYLCYINMFRKPIGSLHMEISAHFLVLLPTPIAVFVFSFACPVAHSDFFPPENSSIFFV